MDLEALEAATINNIHQGLMEKDKMNQLMDVFKFMNFSRDCSLTIKEFKVLFLEKLELSEFSKINKEEDMDLLL